MRIGSVFVSTLLVIACVQSASAATTTPRIVGTTYEQNGSNVCGNSPSSSSGASGGPTAAYACRIDFSAAPTGKLISITRVSCLLVADGSPLYDVFLSTVKDGSDARMQRLEPAQVTQVGNVTTFLVNDDMSFLAGASPSIVMRLFDYGQLSLDCQIKGRSATSPESSN